MDADQTKKVFVTGGSRGIGFALAEGFAREKADVAILYKSDKAQAEKAVAALRVYGGHIIAVQSDLKNPKYFESLIEKIWKELGRIDILINNAGVLTRNRYIDLTQEEIQRVFETNLFAPFLLTQPVVKRMITHKIKGNIINIASIAFDRASGNLSHYEASKAGLVMFTKSLAFELASFGIRANCISPGLVATDINRDQWAGENKREWEKRCRLIPLARVGNPKDLVGAALFLASEEASWITGAHLVVDGGISTHY